MMKQNNFRALLHLFGAEAEGETAQPSVPTPQMNQTGDTESNSLPAAGEAGEEAERKERFRALMEGEYKDLFTAYFQETFNRRFKEQKEMKEELERARTVLGAAAEYFGVAQSELAGVIRAEHEKRNAPTEAPRSTAVPDPEETERRIREAVKQACAKTESRLLADIRARGLRPAEGGLSGNGGNALRQNAAQLSRAQRAEVARRAAKGEHIKL
ncbi:MAG: hypothetical protein IJX39_09560 [Clostridia bacterium]|nr:hypothetical protein [Clostridia bacterium]